MCVIVVKPANFSLSAADTSAMYSRNSDGIGIMYAESGAIRTAKALPATAADAVDFIAEHAPHERECIIHFRYATHGSVSIENTHPFPVVDGLFLAHNGVLFTGADDCGTGTDTEAYIRYYLRPLLTHASDPLEMARAPEFVAVIGEHITGSKFVLLDRHGVVTIINEIDGKTIERDNLQIWCSNLHWQPVDVKKTAALAITANTSRWKPATETEEPAWFSAGYEPAQDDWFIPETARDYIREVKYTFSENGLEYTDYVADAELKDFYALDHGRAWKAIEEFEDLKTTPTEFVATVIRTVYRS